MKNISLVKLIKNKIIEANNNKYSESYGIKVLTNIKNWHKVRREEDAPNRQMYNKDSIGKVGK